MSLKRRLNITRQGVRHILRNVSAIRDGQATKYAILQTSHRLEKGLCIREPKAGWGLDKAEKLVGLLAEEKRKPNPDEMAIRIGEAVIRAYCDEKSAQGEADRVQAIRAKIAENGLEPDDPAMGGRILLHAADMPQAGSADALFLTRHSVRDFADTPVDPEKLERAVTLALRAPSACNRQATQIYVIDGEDRRKAGSANEYHADKYLIITGNMRAFDLSELNDWIVSTSVFCGYLSLALHAEGIGSCIYRKEIIRDSRYNDQMRALCGIPKDEQIILEMAIGNYRDAFCVPVSQRREAKEILHYIG